MGEARGGMMRCVVPMVQLLTNGAMHGWVYVFDHPFFEVTAPAGRYRLENVPPGRYRLEMVHPGGQLRWSETIEVQAGQVIQKDIRVSPDNQVK